MDCYLKHESTRCTNVPNTQCNIHKLIRTCSRSYCRSLDYGPHSGTSCRQLHRMTTCPTTILLQASTMNERC
ncbi:hypothetical protein IEO21_10817 [Rhodonia placenta]|uniref:Uncharacterized protein n=1 Tax=Rhodonia placenta TaxID=104341 RepID=A0A8H7NRR0_9APHY|nr:hypothetical protein IEO21_10817 [Postia placenta]